MYKHRVNTAFSWYEYVINSTLHAFNSLDIHSGTCVRISQLAFRTGAKHSYELIRQKSKAWHRERG